MKIEGTGLPDAVNRLVDVAAIVAAILTVMILLFRVLTHFPFFDETIHAHYLWQFSEGMRPGADFLCVYPALGYLLTLPFMGMFPDSAFIILALRCLSVVIVVLIGAIFYTHGKRVSGEWTAAVAAFLLVVKAPAVGTFFSEYSIDHLSALAAFAAILQFFSKPRLRSIALASALSVLSVAVTPKYPLPLLFGMLGYLAAYVMAGGRAGKAIVATVTGGVATLIGILLIYRITGTSAVDNFRHAFLLQYRWSASNLAFGLQSRGRPLLLAVAEFLVEKPVFGIAVILGLAGWMKRSWRNPDSTALAGAGMLLGALISMLVIRDFHSQYVAPQVLCLALFVPFALSLVRSPLGTGALRFALVAATVFTLLGRMESVAQRFEETPFNVRGVTATTRRVIGKITMAPTGILALSDYDEILDLIPEEERVVAVWPFHPVFRRDQTAIAFDESPSYFFALAPDDAYRRTFEPMHFRDSLEKAPPALINTSRMEFNSPPGWQEAAEDFLASHRDLYALRQTRLFAFWIRRDLIKSQKE